MMICEINRLLHFALQQKLIKKRDTLYCANLLLDVLHLSEFEEQEIDEQLELPDEILEAMLSYAVDQHIIEDTITEKDLFDTRIMNCVMPRPSAVDETFWELYKESPKKATDYYYALSIATNYIRKTRVDKDQKWTAKNKYGEFEITINLSKPEKDPKEIAKLKSLPSASYPKCAICKENEGFAGSLKHAARQSIRLISLQLNQTDWFLQYSPYVYYQEHCIILNTEHTPMKIDERAFQNLLDFLDVFPHYFIGSNADIPIVGGSILSHDHYQGGCYKLPMEYAADIKEYRLDKFPDVQLTHLNWPLTSIRLRGEQKESLIACATHILDTWITYSDESVGIQAYTNNERHNTDERYNTDERHNTITPIARKRNGLYELDLALRNNRTNDEFPLGIFHPHSDVHHIKKENIGLIEVMGLAILPARLKEEFVIIQNCLEDKVISEEERNSIEKHKEWIAYLKEKMTVVDKENIVDFLKREVAIKFERVLEDCGVFRLDEQGTIAFERFISVL